MSTHLPKAGSDINAWIAFNNYFNVINESIDIQLNGNNPPTIKQYFRCAYYKIDSSYTIPASPATGNNEYGVSDNIDYLVNEAIFEDTADLTFTWGGTTRGEVFPAQSDGTWYIILKGSYDQNETTIGQGIYNISKTESPIPSIKKNGAYSAGGYRVVGSFVSTGGVVSDLRTFDNKIYRAAINPNFPPIQVGQLYINMTTGARYISTGIGSTSDWHLVYAYDTVPVIDGGGDVSVNLGGNWQNGKLIVYISTLSSRYIDNATGFPIVYETTYDALTNDRATYSTNHIVSHERDAGNAQHKGLSKSAGNLGLPKSATLTGFVLNDSNDGSPDVEAKWIIIG